MKSVLKKIVSILLPILFWLGIWEISARIVNARYLFPTVGETVTVFFSLLTKRQFYRAVIGSLGRTLEGLLIGTVLGILLAYASHRSKAADLLVSPFLTVVRATPVASIIIILWVLAGGAGVPCLVGILMVTPIVTENLRSGLAGIPKDLSEVADVYRFSAVKRMRYIEFPHLFYRFIPAFKNSVGLAWKAGVAAEIIVYLDGSLGKHIALSKNALEGPELFAWTLTVILLSLLLEKTVSYLADKAVKI